MALNGLCWPHITVRPKQIGHVYGTICIRPIGDIFVIQE